MNTATSDLLKINMTSFMEKLWKKGRKEREKGETMKENYSVHQSRSTALVRNLSTCLTFTAYVFLLNSIHSAE